MVRKTRTLPIQNVFRWFVILFVVSALYITILLVSQQMIRHFADLVPLALNDRVILNTKKNNANFLSQYEKVDPAHSSLPFFILYDQEKNQTASSLAVTNLPTIPEGVLDQAKQYGEYRVTWQPSSNIRLATIVRYDSQQTHGYIVTASSLHEYEALVDRVQMIVGLAWIGTIGAVIASQTVIKWLLRKFI